MNSSKILISVSNGILSQSSKSSQQFLKKLKKIDQTQYFYYNQIAQQNQIFRMQMFPNCTLFVNNDINNRPLMTFNKVNPIFLMINLLFKKASIKSNDIPDHLSKNKNWNAIADQIQTQEGFIIYKFNKQKVLNYLQKKVFKLENFLTQNNIADRIAISQQQGQKKMIFPQTINLLSNQIDEKLIKILCQQRFTVADNNNNFRKHVPEIQQKDYQQFKPRPDPKKNNKKAQKSSTISKNQMTLFASFGKKKTQSGQLSQDKKN